MYREGSGGPLHNDASNVFIQGQWAGIAVTSSVWIAVLGPLELSVDGLEMANGGRRRLALLAILASRANTSWSTGELIDALWPAGSPPSARNSLQSHISRLRRELGDPQRLVRRDDHYTLLLEPDELDSALFARRIADGKSSRRAGDTVGAARQFLEAGRLWRGRPFAGYEDHTVLRPIVEGLVQQHQRAIELWAEADLDLGSVDTVLNAIGAHIATYPLSESLRLTHARALASVGRTTEAVRVIAGYRRSLIELSGMNVGPELVELEHALLAGDRVDRQVPSRELGTSSSAGLVHPLPHELAQLVADPPVGREADVSAILHWLASETPVATIITGEPGVGKTTVAAAVANELGPNGSHRVAYGRCSERLDGAYDAFRHALEPLGLWPRVDWLGQGRPVDSLTGVESDRFRLLQAVVDGLRSLTRPLLLVIDDLQWASLPTLTLLERLVSVDRPTQVSIVATIRSTDVSSGSDHADLVNDLVRRNDAVRLGLAGLTRDDVRCLLARAQLAASATDAEEVRASTDGNPLLVVELIREAQTRGDGRVARSGPVPDAISALVIQRVHWLGAGAEVLQLAATYGSSVPLPVLEAASPMSDGVLEILERAAEVGLVVEERDEVWAFRHALTRDALLETMSGSRRLRCHAMMAKALSSLAPPWFERHRLANHLCAARRSELVGPAVTVTVEVATERLEQRSPEDAVQYVDQAMEVLPLDPGLDPAVEAELHLCAAEAHHLLFHERRWIDSADRAHSCAVLAESAVLQARAALARSPFWTQGRLDEVAFSRLSEALDGLAADPGSASATCLLRARLMAHMAGLLAVAAGAAPSTGPDPRELAEKAVEMAVGGKGRAVEIRALNSLIIALYQEPAAARQLGLSRRLGAIGLPEAEVLALRWATPALLMLGDRSGAETSASDLVAAGRRMGWGEMVAFGIQFQAMLLLVDGEFAEAEVAGAAASEQARHHPNFTRVHGAQLFWAAYQQGRLAELLPFVIETQASEPELACYRAMLGVSYCHLGDLDRAEEQLETLSRNDFSDIPRDILWTSAVAGAIEMSAHLGVATYAETLDRLLRPYAGQVLLVGGSAFVYGATDRFLAMTAALLGRSGSAVLRFNRAIALERSIGGALLAADTEVWRRKLLHGSGQNH